MKAMDFTIKVNGEQSCYARGDQNNEGGAGDNAAPNCGVEGGVADNAAHTCGVEGGAADNAAHTCGVVINPCRRYYSLNVP